METVSGNFLSCSKDSFEFPEFRCDEPPDASEEMGLISLGGENLLDFLELGRVARVKTGTSGTRSGGLRKGQCPCELIEGPLGIPLPSMPEHKALCVVGAGN